MSAIRDGHTCGDCYSFLQCKRLFGCNQEATSCDWDPSRFRGPIPADLKLPEGGPVDLRKMKSCPVAQRRAGKGGGE